jgi:c-di-GMP-binding flagellar brake protein YcgR
MPDQTSGRGGNRAAPTRMSEDCEPVVLQINDQVQATIKGTEGEIPTTYLSRVEDIKGDDLIIGWPTNQGVRAAVRLGDVLSLFYSAKTAVMSVDARITDRQQEPIPTLTVRVEGEIRRIQRREYVRVPAMVEVQLRLRTVTAIKVDLGIANPGFITTRTLNISGGGFAIKHAAHPVVGTEYDVELRIPDVDRPIHLTARTVRVDPLAEPEKRLNICGFAFHQITECIRRQIVSYVFRFQQLSLSRP